MNNIQFNFTSNTSFLKRKKSHLSFLKVAIPVLIILISVIYYLIESAYNKSDIESISLPPPPLASINDSTRAYSHDHDISPLFRPLASSENWKSISVQPGDSLAQIFNRIGLSPSTLHSIIHLNKDTKKLVLLKPGQELQFLLRDGELLKLIFPLSKMQELHIIKTESDYQSEILQKKLETTIEFASVQINNSLYLDAKKVGLSDKLIYQLTNIFNWEIDFNREIRPGDSFSILFEKNHYEGSKVNTGNIIAASFTNRGDTINAVRFKSNDGSHDYYTPAGRSLRKAFLRYPTKHSHISSAFNLRRKHPVLKGVTRPHRATDFAAPLGTPIKAAGNGVITRIEQNSGYGKFIQIKHATRYITLYAHMVRFKSGLQKGSKVKQGDVIGYVGQSGLATGPHLHYEFRIDGKHVNPMTIKLPNTKALNSADKLRLSTKSEKLLAQMNHRKTASLK